MPDVSFQNFATATRLFKDFLYNFPKTAPFLGLDFRRKESYVPISQKLLARKFEREKLSAILTDQSRVFGGAQKTFDNLKKFTRPNTLAVFTGQQTGLFGGPIFTLYKAWTVLQLAEKLEAELGQPIVPFFWMAADDHDLAEVDHTFVLDKNNHLLKLQYDPGEPPTGKPMGKVRFDESIAAVQNSWDEALNPTEFKAEVYAKLSAAYAAGKTFPEAFAAWMNHLLGDSGLIFVNPNDARLKELAVPFFIGEIGLDGTSQSKVAAVNEKLIASGYHVQVHKNQEIVNLFYQPSKRLALRKGEGGFVSEGNDKFTPAGLEKAIHQDPADFSPNVLLRPVLQSYLFPVISVVLGPSEVAYFAQISSLFELHKLPFPVIHPRKSVTLLESRAAKVLGKHNLSVFDFAGNPEALLSRLIRETEVRELATKVQFARKSVQEALDALKRELAALDPTLEKTAEQAKAKLDLEIQNLEKKGVAAAKRKSETLREQIYRTREFLFPQGELQERKLNASYFLVKYGFDLLPRIRGQINFENVDHQVVPL